MVEEVEECHGTMLSLSSHLVFCLLQCQWGDDDFRLYLFRHLKSGACRVSFLLVLWREKRWIGGGRGCVAARARTISWVWVKVGNSVFGENLYFGGV